jgi:hypothetical protein
MNLHDKKGHADTFFCDAQLLTERDLHSMAIERHDYREHRMQYHVLGISRR